MLTSITRTLVPMLVALLGPWVAQYLGVGDNDLGTVLTIVIAAAYYVLARLLEQYVPAAGWLLGVPKAPTYAPVGPDGAHDVTSLPR